MEPLGGHIDPSQFSPDWRLLGTQPMDEANSPTPKNTTLWFGIALEGVLVLVAIGLSFIGLYDFNQPLADLGWPEMQSGLIWGMVASLPLLGYLIVFNVFRNGWLSSLHQFCEEHLRPMFQGSTIWELALLSVAAGIGEELLFRWCFQGGLSSLFEPRFDQPVAGMIGLFIASFLFGLCHAVTKLYFAVTFFSGIFLGWTMIATSNWLVPAFAHAIYDFVALVYLVKIMDLADSVKAEP